MNETWLITARFVHYAAVMAMFGLALFPLYAFDDAGTTAPLRFHDWNRRVIFLAAAAALLTAILCFQCVTANMSGLPSAAMDPAALYSVLCDTAFGQVWGARLVLSALLFGLAGYWNLVSRAAPISLIVTMLSAALLASLASTGHTMHTGGASRAVHIAADGGHLLAAGAWLGGLISLGFVMTKNAGDVRDVLQRFSGMGTLAVAALVGSGLINSWFLVGNVSNLVGTPYGQLLLVKLCFFTAMLALAAANRFWLVPALSHDAGDAQAATLKLRRHVFAEQVLGGLVILIVSVLGTLEPAVG
jgi:copper resistance protein D